MKDVPEQDRQPDVAARDRRKRIADNAGRVVILLTVPFWLFLFVTAVRTGYLSWIAIAVGAIFVTSLTISPILSWAGRKRLAGVFLAVPFAIIALYLLSGAMAMLWPEGNGTWHPYRFDDELAAIEAKRAVPDAENAARRYDLAFAGMDEGDEPNFIFSGVSIRDELGKQPWKGDDYRQASEWLDSQSAMIARLLEIGRMEKCRWPVQADTYDEYTVPYRKLNHSVKLLLAAGNRDLGKGRVTEALTKYWCILRIADHVRQQPSMVDSLTGFRCERNGLQMIRHVLVQSDLSDEDIAQVANHLPKAADPWPQEWERLLEFEKLHYMNFLGELYEVNDKGAVRFAACPVTSPKTERGRKDAKRASRFPRLYWLMSMPRDPHAVREIADRYFAKFEHIANSERLPQVDRYEPPARVSRTDFAKTACNPYRWCAETFFFDEQEYIQHRHLRTPSITSRRGTWLVYGLRRYHEVHGAWPPTLDAIADFVPAEAFFDPTAGEAFVYTPDGDSFKLYSKGFNRIDEGGRSGYVRALDKSEDDIWLWPPPPVRESEPLDDEEVKKQMEEIYGKDYAETFFKDDGSDKR